MHLYKLESDHVLYEQFKLMEYEEMNSLAYCLNQLKLICILYLIKSNKAYYVPKGD